MAFQAEGGHGGAHQHLGIVGAVRLVATLATAQPDGGMLEEERPLLFLVALEADLLAGEVGPEQPPVNAAVRLMAVDALDRALFHPVVERF